MNFLPTDEQRQLAESVSRLLEADYAFEKRRALAAQPRWAPAAWDRLMALGLGAMAVSESHGGYGGRSADLKAVFQAFGRALLIEPALSALVLGPVAVSRAGSAQQRAQLLPEVAAGNLRLGWAHDEAGARCAQHWVQTRARRGDDGLWRLDGAKQMVLYGEAAQRLVVSARLTGDTAAPQGLGLFLVDPGAASLTLRPYRLIDDTRAAALHLDGTPAEPLGETAAGTAAPAIEAACAAGIAAACADMVGAMEAAFELTVDYVKVRRQFGRAIGENQALRHRVAEMFVSLELARSMAFAAVAAADDDTGAAWRDTLRAKAAVGRHARSLCHLAVQLHGGIGMTEETPVGHYLRRVTVLDQLFGDTDVQLARLARRMQDLEVKGSQDR